jgi:hypothetical protein
MANIRAFETSNSKFVVICVDQFIFVLILSETGSELLLHKQLDISEHCKAQLINEADEKKKKQVAEQHSTHKIVLFNS